MRLSTLTLAGALLLAAGCAAAAPSPAPTGSAAALTGTLTIFAAASLTESFTAMASEFTKAHPDVTVRPSFASSSTLAAQIAGGADADLFASADEANMTKLTDDFLAEGAPVIFARNRLQIVVQAGNPKHVTGLAGLARPDLVVVLGAPPVPVGVYAQQALAKAAVTAAPRSLETDVKQVIAKVALGEADAGIVYTTDVRSAGAKVEGVDIPDADNVVASYPIAVLRGTRNAGTARAFVAFVRSPDGTAILERFGFAAP